ncbi:ATP-binding protein [Taibaiella soli]|uniref:Rhodanese domain-containing protein n=1 Tax=Taibaiella soli TaxID=1649169 RepID=A0A2W2AXA1_9BACT|nr:ATP-binding protein [Taibaiella soli]PZF72614.1 hypothetical protein DN068_12165 [Taibaiella soli]
MAQKPFKVSARTARLIGRENVSNVDGAIIELVKNCFDADSPICILYFDIQFEFIPETISLKEYQRFVDENPILNQGYSLNRESKFYFLDNDCSDDVLKDIEFFFKSKNQLFIIDQGDGMTEEVIDKHWMTIGTNNKLSDVFTGGGRVKVGAKGIGRFALDRLGSTCHMITLPKGKKNGFNWLVNWEDFEKDGAIIGDINADFTVVRNLNLRKTVVDLTGDARIAKIITSSKLNFDQGTCLHIGNLRDWWTEKTLSELFENLETLSPPGNKQKFQIELISRNYPVKFGRVANETYSDFDYRIFAKVNSDKSIEIKVDRNELQVNKIDKDLFKRKAMLQPPYDYQTFKKGSFEIKTSINDLLPWLANSSFAKEANNLKNFDFLFYFIKQASTQNDKERFGYRSFNRTDRASWFRKFGGIKVFRDNFRVRPYGEFENASFDWLLLGDRQAKSPAGITKHGGGWRVAPNQVAGIVNISRISNLNFEDKSSREGFQENDTFYIFKLLLLEIIHVFEIDRHDVMREIDLLKREKKDADDAKRKAEELIEEGEDHEINEESKTKDDFKEERDTFKSAFSSIKADLDDAEEQIRILSALATTGLIITSFAHEFPSFKNKLIRSTNNLSNSLDKELNRSRLEKKLDAKHNPFNHLDNLKKAHEGITHWLDLSLAAVRKDKRALKNIDLKSYLSDFKNETWKEVLIARKTTLLIDSDNVADLTIKGFLIDVDSIFNNLLINSFDAFDRKGFSGERTVRISIDLIVPSEDEKEYILIHYKDSGPGLLKSIENPYNILRRGYTTKVNSENEQIGTGLGMWIISEAVSFYGGIIELLSSKTGFELKILIPYKKASNE